jgi:PhzF family phenazine biosynthesis protein
MSVAYVIVDVLTDTLLRGNQLAVLEDGSALSDDQMQRLAREMNLSETVFRLPAEDGGDARVRIFNAAPPGASTKDTTELPPVGWHLPVIQS